MSAYLKSVAVYLPDRVVTNAELEEKIRLSFPALEFGMLEKILGIKTRRFAATDMQVSDLACAAAQKILDVETAQIDLLIFAAASSDLIEPATASIVQHKLGLTCPVLDIKNACNSVTTAIQVASAFIESKMYQHILIVSGEKLSEVINFKPIDSEHFMRCVPAYGLGDAGAAILMSSQAGAGKLLYQKFQTWGQFWPLCKVEGGGSLAYWDQSKYYFEGHGRALQDAFKVHGAPFVKNCLSECGISIDDIDLVVAHQVSKTTPQFVSESTGICASKIVCIFPELGNIAAASIPVALHHAHQTQKILPNQKVMLIGLAAGISVSVQIIQY
jgi:acyl-CoA:acyl-CoA alkyltransferase